MVDLLNHVKTFLLLLHIGDRVLNPRLCAFSVRKVRFAVVLVLDHAMVVVGLAVRAEVQRAELAEVACSNDG
jgi:hypothetical protein